MTILDDGFEPRPDASKLAAAKHRERPTKPPAQAAPNRLLAGAVAAVLLAALAIIASQGVSQPRPLAATPAPTADQPTPARPTTPPAAPTARVATIAPSSTPVLNPAPVAAPVVPQTGRGLGMPPTAPLTPDPPVAPTYLEVVAAQAPHSPRGNGQPGPSGAGSGDWAIVPTLAPEQLQVVQQQKPHKVR